MKVALIICIVVIALLVYWIYLDVKDGRKLRKRVQELERDLDEIRKTN